jgi:hypothetical protein
LEVPDLFFGLLLFISGVVIGAFSNILEDCTFTPYESWKGKRYIRIENHESLKSLIDGFWWIFNFFRVDGGVTKESNHRGRGEHRELLFSLCPLCALWFFQNPFQKIIKSLGVRSDWGRFYRDISRNLWFDSEKREGLQECVEPDLMRYQDYEHYML